MPIKQHTDKIAAEALIEQIDAAEHNLRLIKQHIDPNTGTVNNIKDVAWFFNRTDDCMKTINNLLVKFL